MLDLARDVMQLPCTSSHMDGTIRQGFTPPAGFQPHVQAAMTSPAHKKKTSQSEGFSTRAHVLCSSVTCAMHSANRTHSAGHIEFRTRVRVENPSVPNSTTQPGLCPSAGSATSTACVPGPGLTRAAEHVGVSCVARHGPPVHCRANPARPNCNYRRYRPFVPPLSQSLSPCEHMCSARP